MKYTGLNEQVYPLPSPQSARAVYTIEVNGSRIVPVPEALLHKVLSGGNQAWTPVESWHRFPAHHVSTSPCPSLSTHPAAWCLIPDVLSAQLCHLDGWEKMLSRGIMMPIHSFPPAKVNSVLFSDLTFLHAPSNSLLGLGFFSLRIHGSYL